MTFTVDFAPGAGPLDVIGDIYLNVDGGATADASTPDAAALDITGDIDLRVELTLANWVPPTTPVFLGKWDTASQQSYIFWMSGGFLAFNWSTTGANQLGASATAAIPITTKRIAIRVTLDVDNGAAGNTVTFYTAPSIGGTWTQLGDAVTQAGTTSIFNSTSLLRVGRSPTFTASEPARYHKAEVRNGIAGTVVANPDFTIQTVGASSFNDGTGKTWTINATAKIAGFTWVSLTSRLVAATWSDGRVDELEAFGPGEATLILRNDDRVLDPDHAGGPYFGKLLPRTPFRIREDVAGTFQDRFYGFVESGFGQEYLPPKTAMCTVKLTDRLAAVAGQLPDVYDHAIQARAPVGYWVLATDSGTESVADLTGGGRHGTVIGDVRFGERQIRPSHGTSALFPAADSGVDNNFAQAYVDVGRSPLLDATLMDQASVVVTFIARSAATQNIRKLFVHGNGNAGLYDAVDLDVRTTGKLQYGWLEDNGGQTYEWPNTVIDNRGHIVFGQGNGIAVDTATLNTTTVVGLKTITNGVGIGGHSGIDGPDCMDGWIGAAALYSRLLTLPERQVLVDGFGHLDSQTSDKHIGWALDRIGVPDEHRNIDVGTVVMGPANPRGRDALEFIREVVATEQGEFYVDHRDGGKLRFRHRYARFLDSRSTSSQATFSDNVLDPTVVGIQVGGLEVASNGIDGVVNQAAVRWRDGEETVADTPSVTAFGPQTRNVATQATTAGQARSVGEWLVARYKDPRSRVRAVGTRPDASTAALTAARNVKIGDRVTYRLHPQLVGSATVLDLFVEGIGLSISDGTVREARYRLAPVNTFTPWIWGTSAWGTTKIWG